MKVHYLAVFVMLIVSIGAMTSRESTAQDTSTVRFAFWGDPAEQDAYLTVIEGFEAANPGISVEADYTPGQSDFYRKIATDFAAGDPPDIFLTNYRNFGQYAAAGALLPVEEYIQGSEAFDMEDFFIEPMDAFRYRGGPVSCMPQNVSSLVVYFNVDLFAANGQPLPASGWTWEEVIDAASALT
ncbi:MAG: ABC transporter substrate-binding protein, partial [Thermomicrobiales bacterium]